MGRTSLLQKFPEGKTIDIGEKTFLKPAQDSQSCLGVPQGSPRKHWGVMVTSIDFGFEMVPFKVLGQTFTKSVSVLTKIHSPCPLNERYMNF